jgi:hypothetical protein
MAGAETHAPAERPDPDAGFTGSADKTNGVTKSGADAANRLQEVRQSLHTRLPVYVVLTKLDLLTGFSSWFQALDRRDRDAFWESRLRVMPMKATTGVLN